MELSDMERRAALRVLTRSRVTGIAAAFTPCKGLSIIAEGMGEADRDQLIAIHRNVEYGIEYGSGDDAELGRIVRAVLERHAVACGDLERASADLFEAAADAKAHMPTLSQEAA